MPKHFERMLKKAFPEPAYSIRGNLCNNICTILNVGGVAKLSLEDVMEIAKDALMKLDYKIFPSSSASQFFAEGHIVVDFPKRSHFIAFPPPGADYLTATLNIGWRGELPLTPHERKSYLALLKNYFG